MLNCIFRQRFSMTHILAATLFWLCLLPAAQAESYTILTPVPADPVILQARRAVIHLVVQVADSDEASGLRVHERTGSSATGKEIRPVGIWKKQQSLYVHYRLKLKSGLNTFVFEPGEEKLTIRYRPVHTLTSVDFEDPQAFLFHRKKVVPTTCLPCHTEKLPEDSGLDVARSAKDPRFSPLCFSCHRRLITKEKWLHGPSANVDCMACHIRDGEKTKITIPFRRRAQLCFDCHVNKIRLMNKKFLHGPFKFGDCTVCHDPHGDAYKFQLWADGRAELCVECHSDKKKSLKKSLDFVTHGIIEGSGCIACHDPHAEANPFQLYKPINELCVSCHTRLQGIDRGHPVGNHPLKGVKDPLRKGRELACSSCHNPHGSKYRYILIGDPLGGRVCGKCHH